MKRMIPIFLFALWSFSAAAQDVVYYDSHGNEVSESTYREIAEKWNESVMEKKRENALKKAKIRAAGEERRQAAVPDSSRVPTLTTTGYTGSYSEPVKDSSRRSATSVDREYSVGITPGQSRPTPTQSVKQKLRLLGR